MSPLYIYYCDTCKHEQEELFSLKNKPSFLTCRNCGKKAKAQVSSANFQVNGANAANRYAGDSNIRWFRPGEPKQ